MSEIRWKKETVYKVLLKRCSLPAAYISFCVHCVILKPADATKCEHVQRAYNQWDIMGSYKHSVQAALMAQVRHNSSCPRCLHLFFDILAASFCLITEYILSLTNKAFSWTTLHFIHFDVYLCHDKAIKENICQLSVP